MLTVPPPYVMVGDGITSDSSGRMLPDIVLQGAALLQGVLDHNLAELVQGGWAAVGGLSDLRLCSQPTLLTGDDERVVGDLIKEENITEHNDEGEIDGDGRDLKLVAAASGDDFCCPPVVDSSTWLALVGGMAIVTYFLRLQITQNLGRKRRRRMVGLQNTFFRGECWQDHLLKEVLVYILFFF